MSQTSFDNMKVANKINIARILTSDHRKSKNQKNHGSQSQWISSRSCHYLETPLLKSSITTYR